MKCFKIIYIIFSISCFFSHYQKTFAQDKLVENTVNIQQDNFKQENLSGYSSYGSVFDRISHAGWVVFLVLISLVFLSVLSWAIIFSKYFYLKKVSKQSKIFLDEFWRTESLNILYDSLDKFPRSPAKEIFRQGYSELLKTNHIQSRDLSLEAKARVVLSGLSRSLYKTKIEQKKSLERFLSFLAITASSAPFIGLFGTVWGIMNSFESIAVSGNSSLASVAPGISEALIATAFGLAAAIPAVIGYNISNVQIKSIILKVEGFTDEFLNIVERYVVINNTKAENRD